MSALVVPIVIVAVVVVLVVLFLVVCYYPGAASKIEKVSPTLKQTADELVPYEKNKQVWSTDRKDTRKVVVAKSGIASDNKDNGTALYTVPQIFKKACESSGDKPALRWEDAIPFNPDVLNNQSVDFAKWNQLTWKQYYDTCFKAATSFLGLGLQRGDAVTIYGFNSPEWLMAQNAAMMAGGIAAGIYPSDTPAQVIYKARQSSASICVCEAKKAQIFRDAFARGDLPKLRAIVVWNQSDNEDLKSVEGKASDWKLTVTTWASVSSEPAKYNNSASASDDVNKVIDGLKPEDVACYIYTSGTTGDPKAVMITHDNIIFESNVARSLLPASFGVTEERILSYLPLSHVAGCMVDIVMPIVTTAQCEGHVVIGFARIYDLSKGTVGQRLSCLKPTIFLGVPRVWEKIAEKIKKIGLTITGTKKKISTYCKAKGLEYAENCEMGGTGVKPSMYPFAEKIVFKGLKAKLGLTECKFAFTGAAPISKETLQYFGQLGLQINEVYGMSECTGATTWSTDSTHVWGSCGFAMPGTEVKVFNVSETDLNDKKEVPAAEDPSNPTEEEQGELCYRGRHIMAGYMANPDLGEEHVALIAKKTSEAIDADGWLHSGDKGCVSKEGMFRITGRYKELIIGSGGENIAPVPIEDFIKAFQPAISNIMMIGDKKKYNTAFVTLKAEGATGELAGGDVLADEAAALVPGVTTISQAAESKEYIKFLVDAVKEANAKVCPSNASKIQKITILPHDFSVETGELTPTLKLKRSHVAKSAVYQDVIERLYAPGAPEFVPFKVAGEVAVAVAAEAAPTEAAPTEAAPATDAAAPVASTDSA